MTVAHRNIRSPDCNHPASRESHTVLLTGATGLLGSFLLRRLLEAPEVNKIIAITRPRKNKSGYARVLQALTNIPRSYLHTRQIKKKLTVWNGDISRPCLGLDKTSLVALSGVDLVYHIAAVCDLRASSSSVDPDNVGGTRNLLELIARLKSKNGRSMCGIHYVSTIAVMGTSQTQFGERSFDIGQSFNNAYEKSKFRAEQVVRQYQNQGLPIAIYRPGIITGDSVTGYTSNFKMFYQPLHFFSLELFDEIPADRNSLHTLVPVDYVSSALFNLSMRFPSSNRTFHLINPHEITFDFFLSAASQFFGFKKPRYIPTIAKEKNPLSKIQYQLISPFLPYFNYKARRSSLETQETLRSLGFEWPLVDEGFLHTLFRYCVQSNFIRPWNKQKMALSVR